MSSYFSSLQVAGFTREEPQEFEICAKLSYPQRIAGFILCILAALVFLFLCVANVTSVMLGRPDKFAVPFVAANILMLVSTCFLVGVKRQLSDMFSSPRMTASVIYISSMLATLYLALFVQRWWLVLPMIGVQVASLLWYGMSYVPMGQAMLQKTFGWCFRCCFKQQDNTMASILPI